VKEFVEIYNVLNECFDTFNINRNTYYKNINRAVELAEKLHYIFMPIYSEQLIIDRGCLPEKQIRQYYNNFFAIKNLYYELNNQGKDWRSIDGDINLNQDMKFTVYTASYGEEKGYIIRRNYKGWDVKTTPFDEKTEKKWYYST